MYTFRDINDASDNAVMPSEALKLNGEYIEDLIPGYRTLYVKGREALSPELDYIETGIRDGAALKYKRYPARYITVGYQLLAASNEAFRSAYNTLGGILDVTDAQLVFNDEDDKYFTGTPSLIGEVPPGTNYVVGEIEFICTDPFKYSLLEYEAEPWEEDPSTILIDYGGTYRAFPELVANFHSETEVAEDGETAGVLTGNGDCGYIAFFNEYEKIVQMGDPDELDSTVAYEKSQTLINQAFAASTAWGTAAKALWTANAGMVLPADVQQLGSVGMGVASYAVPATPKATSGTLLNKKLTPSGDVPFYYTVTAKTSGRTANSIKVTLAITASLKRTTNYFGRGYGVKGAVYIGGAWREVTIKKTSEYWKGQSGHTVNLAVTVTGLSSTTAALTGIKFKTWRTDNTAGATSGVLPETSCSNLAISTYVADVPETYYLHATGYGTAAGKWHGPSITRALPADASGAVGAADFTFTYKQKMCIGSGKSDTNQLGGFHAHLAAADGTIVAGVRIVKSAAGKSGNLVLYINGAKVHQVSIDLSYANKYFGTNAKAVQTSKIVKSGNKITFNIGSYTKTFTDDAVKDLAVTKATFMFEQYASKTALAYNGIYNVKFVKNNCDTLKDIPNKFSADDVLTADCSTGDIYLNGALSPELGALGNDWEGFYLTPGLNQIGFAYSDWVEAGCEPKPKVRYREAFL